MDVLYFAFANPPDHPLEELKREDLEINSILEPLAARNNFRIVRDQYATIDAVVEKLSLFKNDLVLFHFSGHAGADRIELMDAVAKSTGIAELLASCPKLLMVVLNGCATYPQVKHLQEINIPLVIATHRPVEDPKAAAFAIQFYRSLAFLDTIEGSFNAALGKLLAMDDKLSVERGLDLRSKPENTDGPCWGLFKTSGREDVLKWSLINISSDLTYDDFQPNQLLLQTLLEAFAPYRADVANILKKEEDGFSTVSVVEKRRAVLEALPHPVSELIRFLLLPRTSGSQEVFFDELSLGRLKQIYAVYLTVIDLMTFIMLAQLWDIATEKEGIELPENTQKLIIDFLMSNQDERLKFDHIALIRAIRLYMDESGEAYFVEELAQLVEIVQQGSPLSVSDQFFRDLEPRLKSLGDSAGALLCIEAEEHLSNVMKHLGFVARYIFASVKNIDVLKYRHKLKPLFKHSILKLEQRFVGLAAESKVIGGILNTDSVILLKETDAEELPFLNLSPFIIDQNAFDEKATIAKLHFLMCYVKDQDSYLFRHIYMANDMPLLIGKQPVYKIIKEQFDALAQLLFQKPMKNAVE